MSAYVGSSKNLKDLKDVSISFEPQFQNEGQSKLVLESEVELLQLARENVEALWADEDEEDEGEGDEERDEL